MIIKSYQTSKINFDISKYILFYGKNEGLKKEEINKIISLNKKKELFNYDEKKIIDDQDNFFNTLMSGSLFDKEKIIIINYASEKILKIIQEIIDKKLEGIIIVINAGILEKKSKLRAFFEKSKDQICIPFYSDTNEVLSKIVYDFLKKTKISISQANINLIVNRCNGDRGYLKNELNKIETYSKDKKNISTEEILRLTNLTENYSFSELIDNCLAKNKIKTINILNENNFLSDDCIIIIRTFIYKAKRILKLSNEFKLNNDLEKTILSAKPPIFWKEKEIVKLQISKWSPEKIEELIFSLNDIELQIKRNFHNPINLISNFILEKSS